MLIGDDLLNLFNSSGYAGRHNFNDMWNQLLTPAGYLRYIELTESTASIPEEYRDVLAPPEIAEKAAYLYRLYSVSVLKLNSIVVEDPSYSCIVLLRISQGL